MMFGFDLGLEKEEAAAFGFEEGACFWWSTEIADLIHAGDDWAALLEHGLSHQALAAQGQR